MTASSMWNYRHAAYLARLNRMAPSGWASCWSAKHNNHNQWIQVRLSRATRVTKIITQGRGDMGQWVKNYRIGYSSDEINFAMVVDYYNNIKVRKKLELYSYIGTCI